MSRKMFLIFCLLTSVLLLQAQNNKNASFSHEQNDSTRVLFIGNSYTRYNKMPQTVKDIAETQKVYIAYTAITPGGAKLSQHVNDEYVIELIKKGHWDYVILQDQSSAPAYTSELVMEHVYMAATSLDSLIHAHNTNARVIFYMTWGHKDGCQKPIENYPLINTYEGMQERLKLSYLEMAYRNKAWCAPVGMVWQQVRRERPDYILYHPDRSHPSRLGSYLAANVIFSTIYQKPYQTNVTDELPADQAEYIQQVAQKTVFQNMELINIHK